MNNTEKLKKCIEALTFICNTESITITEAQKLAMRILGEVQNNE